MRNTQESFLVSNTAGRARRRGARVAILTSSSLRIGMDRTLYFACNSFDNEADMMIRFAPDEAAKCALRDFPWSELTVVRNFIFHDNLLCRSVGDFGGILIA
jgi:hypothetical protein